MGNETCYEKDYLSMNPSWKAIKDPPRIYETYDERGRFEHYSLNSNIEGIIYFKSVYRDRDKVYNEFLEKANSHKFKLNIRRFGYASRQFSKKIAISTIDDKIIRVSQELSQLVQSIEESKYILELKDNWDDDGAKAYSKYTWGKAINFIVEYAEWILANCSKIISSPKIYHGPDGSIDLYWKNSSFNLLINIPEKDDALGTFYGDDYKGQKIEGEFNPKNISPSLFPSLINLI